MRDLQRRLKVLEGRREQANGVNRYAVSDRPKEECGPGDDGVSPSPILTEEQWANKYAGLAPVTVKPTRKP